jgi:hypothetical protein
VIVVITEREVLCGERRLCCKIKPIAGCTGKGDREKRERERERERERDLQAKSVDRNVRFHLIYYKEKFCGCSPR